MKLFSPAFRQGWTALVLAIAVGLLSYLAIYVWIRVGRPFVMPNSDPRADFSYFYAAAKAMTLGQDIYTAQPPDRDRPGYIYPPMVAFLYQPLAHLDIVTAARISLLINLTAITAALAFTARAILERFRCPPDGALLLTVTLLAALLSLDKIKGELQMLQTDALVACGIALGFWLLDRRPFWAGAAIAFAVNVKYQALALLVYLIFRRRWKPAAATLFWIAVWATLPALSVGWNRDMHYLLSAPSGLLRLVGIDLGGDVANVEPLASGFSICITSAAARVLEYFHSPLNPFLVTAAIALLWCSTVALFYRAWKRPVFLWPDDALERPDFRQLVAIEWVAVIACVLAFSPQTNPRHMVHSLALNVLGVVLVLQARGRFRAFAIAGLILLWMGLNLPPGRYTDQGRSFLWWRFVGGAGFTVIIAMALLIWAGLGTIARAIHRTSPVMVPSPKAVVASP